jgi:hypothetical protein
VVGEKEEKGKKEQKLQGPRAGLLHWHLAVVLLSLCHVCQLETSVVRSCGT